MKVIKIKMIKGQVEKDIENLILVEMLTFNIMKLKMHIFMI